MEPADHAQLRSKLGQQDALLESQQQQLLAVMQCVLTISHQMAMLSTAVQSACPTTADGTATPAAAASSGGARGLPRDLEVREPRLVQRSTWGMQGIPHPMPADIPPPATDVPH